MKNLFRIIHPNRMGAIRASEVKQLFLNAKPGRLELVINHLKKKLDSIYFIHCTAVYKLAEVPGVVRGILKVEVKQKIYLAYVIPNGIHEFPYGFLNKVQPI